MPFRDRMRKAFGRTPSDIQRQQQGQQQQQQQPQKQQQQPPRRDAVPKRTREQMAHVYRIGDPMPAPKYPGKYDKPHQEVLRAFSFTKAMSRRRSSTTDISPLNSRWASRRNSEVTGSGRASTGRRPSNVARGVLTNGDIDMDDVVGPHGNLARSYMAEPPQRRNAYVVGVAGPDDSLTDGRTSESSAYYTADE